MCLGFQTGKWVPAGPGTSGYNRWGTRHFGLACCNCIGDKLIYDVVMNPRGLTVSKTKQRDQADERQADGRQADGRTTEEREWDAIVTRQVLADLGTPPGLHLVVVKPLFTNRYRINVLVENLPDERLAVRMFRISHSYFAHINEMGKIIRISPAISHQYGRQGAA